MSGKQEYNNNKCTNGQSDDAASSPTKPAASTPTAAAVTVPSEDEAFVAAPTNLKSAPTDCKICSTCADSRVDAVDLRLTLLFTLFALLCLVDSVHTNRGDPSRGTNNCS